MKCRLKDKALQERVKAVFPSFDGLLEVACSTLSEHQPVFVGAKDGCLDWGMYIDRDAIDITQDYNPNGWNEFPEVIPPEGVWMRVVMHSRNDKENVDRKMVAYYKYGAWRNADGVPYPSWYTAKRYRPWVDPDEEEESCGT